MTKLKPIWHRTTPIGGNGQTPCVSKYALNRFEDNAHFLSTHTANFKMVVSFSPNDDSSKDITLMSLDTGMAGNLFAGNYFDMNLDHLYGRLKTMKVNSIEALLKDEKNHVLILNPLSTKKKRVIRPIEEQLVDEHLGKEKMEQEKLKSSDDLDSLLAARDKTKGKKVDPDPHDLYKH